MVVRGVPHRLAKDAWWLDDVDPPIGLRALPVLLVVVILADWLVWGGSLGLGFAIWMLVVGCAVTLTIWRAIDPRRSLAAWGLLVLAILPLLEVVQFVTVMIAIIGLMSFAVIIASDRFEPSTLFRAVLRLPGFGVVQTVQDTLALRVSVPSKGVLQGAVFDWALPLGAGGMFLILFAAANPFIDQWLLTFSHWNTDFLPQWERFVFWGFLAFAIWPVLRLTIMMPALNRTRSAPTRILRSGFLNARSVMRALVIFNVIFAVQTSLDLGYLWGGVALPEGMTYAQYAHRGAYPLLATAVLAGLFALMSQPYLGKGAGVRGLLYLWIAQTVLLVVSSILRLDLYVGVYGLTQLRFAAFIWMMVVASGLVLIIMQMIGRHSVGWFLHRALGLGLLALYGCSLVNIDGYIARHNLANDRANDFYLCSLSEGAIPAIRAYEAATGEEHCYSYRPVMSEPNDWREWGYRNARLRRSLAILEDAQ